MNYGTRRHSIMRRGCGDSSNNFFLCLFLFSFIISLENGGEDERNLMEIGGRTWYNEKKQREEFLR